MRSERSRVSVLLMHPQAARRTFDGLAPRARAALWRELSAWLTELIGAKAFARHCEGLSRAYYRKREALLYSPLAFAIVRTARACRDAMGCLAETRWAPRLGAMFARAGVTL